MARRLGAALLIRCRLDLRGGVGFDASMRDPFEGVDADGTIRTGAVRGRVPAAFEPVIGDLVSEFHRVHSPATELHLYGSVATGMARAGESDVDLLVIDAERGWAADVAGRLSRRYTGLCRGVEIGTARNSDYAGPGDEAYGNRVFLRHYCVPLAGPDAIRAREPFAGDVRAARGFNGDIMSCLTRWRADGASAQRVARKTLVAAAGIVSVRTENWTTDRTTAVDAWEQVADHETPAMRKLLDWVEGTRVAAPADLLAALSDDGIVHSIAARFAAEIGVWA